MSRLKSIAGKAIDGIRINSIWSETRDGRQFWIKKRRVCSSGIVRCANAFFRLAQNPVVIWPRLEQWQRWEIECFRMLNEDFSAFADGPRSICAENLPGKNLVEHLLAGTLTPVMVEAAAIELRRSHCRYSKMFGDAWSHGDPHMGNFIFDETSGRARMIDFEVAHHRALPVTERHADDLLVFLQDLVGRAASADWVPLASAFVRAYDDKLVLGRLKRRLVVPNGLPGVWWAIRTSYIRGVELRARMSALREVI